MAQKEEVVTQYSWGNCPDTIQTQLAVFIATVKEPLPDNLVGVYLHGSLAMGCFNPDRSDVDLLMVTRQKMALKTKRELVEILLKFSNSPAPIEVSFLHQPDLKPWQHPLPFDLHYSESWREKYKTELQTGTWQQWNSKQDYDEDLAAHITVTLHRGICLSGQPIKAVFPDVPQQDYLASILSDFEWAKARLEQQPDYFVLNSCRILAYVQSGAIYSKDEGGVWGLKILPENYRETITSALEMYRGQLRHQSINWNKLAQFIDYTEEMLNDKIS